MNGPGKIQVVHGLRGGLALQHLPGLAAFPVQVTRQATLVAGAVPR